MAARRPFWEWHRWKSIGFCLWRPSICIWNLKLKFQSELDLCSGNHVVYRQTDGQTDRRTMWIQYTPPPTSLGGGITSPSCYGHFVSLFVDGWFRNFLWIVPIRARVRKASSLDPWRFERHFNEASTVIGGWNTSHEIALRWMNRCAPGNRPFFELNLI